MTKLPGVASKLAQWGLDLLFPLHCFGCGQEGGCLCDACTRALPRLEEPYCRMCAQPSVPRQCPRCADAPLHTDGIRCPFLLEGAVREAVHGLKYRGIRVAAAPLGGLLARYLESHPLPGDVLAPVPMHPRKLRQRGYNQSALLAKEVGRITGLPQTEGLLARVSDAPPQARAASVEQRQDNVAGSFACPGNAEGLSVLVVDDVATTGSTLSACAQALKDAGASSVWGLALAREE